VASAGVLVCQALHTGTGVITSARVDIFSDAAGATKFGDIR